MKPRPDEVRAVGYVRISKADRGKTDDEQRLSIRQQRETIRHHCEAKGWTLVAVHEDFALSGADDSRAGLGQVAALIDGGHADVVVVRHVDRLYRKAWRLLQLVDSPDEGGRGWDVVSVEQAFDTREPEGWFAFAQFALFGDYERRVIGKRTRLALAQRRREGKHNGRRSRIPSHVEDRILALVEDGMSATAVASQMERERVERPTASSKAWHHSHVTAAAERARVRRRGQVLADLL
ncbi:recombinase family protein [Aeromicrobium sp.]|uniref:recombinase family protein n=1 Tax=Aeromicrobium sp. TaxID=1871063 RepID=UPI0040336647